VIDIFEAAITNWGTNGCSSTVDAKTKREKNRNISTEIAAGFSFVFPQQ
jgi:hypothetical protein